MRAHRNAWRRAAPTSMVALLTGLTAAPPAAAQKAAFHDARSVIASADARLGESATADFDGDGIPDVLLGNDGADSAVVLSTGNGGLDRARHAIAGSGSTLAVAVGDLDGDGDVDAVLARRAGFPGLVALNDGTGRLSTSQTLPTDDDERPTVALGDLDADGDLDVFVGAQSAQGSVFLNDGTGSFQERVGALPPNGPDTTAAALADLDGDARLDLLVGRDGDQNLLLLGNGDGTFTDATLDLRSDIAKTRCLALGDVDGTGTLDVLWGNVGYDRLHVNDGSAHFTEISAQLPFLFETTTRLSFWDYDADGDLDYVANPLRLLENDGRAFFTEVPGYFPLAPTTFHDVEVADFDADGDDDLLLAPERLLLAAGSGSFVLAAPGSVDLTPSGFGGVGAAAVGDVNGDGEPDLFLGSRDDPERLFLGDGSGPYLDASANLPGPDYRTEDAGFADFDEDGDLDLFLVNVSPSRTDKLLSNDGTGVFTEASVGNRNGLTLALGDFDGDRHVDAFVGNDGPDEIWINDGAGGLSQKSSTLFPAGAPNTNSYVAAGDFDQDGDLDVFIGRRTSSPRPDSLWLNDGLGGFEDASSRLVPAVERTNSVALLDVEGDGDLDLFSGTLDATESYLLQLNDGSASFTDGSAQLPAFFDASRHIATADFDGDGDDDAWLGTSSTDADRLLWNDGNGSFTDGSADLPPGNWFTDALAVADLDGDGDLDVASSTGNLFLGTTRHVGWVDLPRTGELLELAVSGPPSGFWFLLLAPASGQLELPPFGTYRLDPFTAFTLASGFLDADGHASLGLAVPDDPTLVAASFYWQALVGLPARFTNLEVTTFLGP